MAEETATPSSNLRAEKGEAANRPRQEHDMLPRAHTHTHTHVGYSYFVLHSCYAHTYTRLRRIQSVSLMTKGREGEDRHTETKRERDGYTGSEASDLFLCAYE